MHILMTGASGYVGSAVATRLLDEGHRITALARSDETAEQLVAGGMNAHRGDIASPESVRPMLSSVDAVVHVAVGLPRGVTEDDIAFVDMLVEGLSGTDKPLVVTSGLGVYAGVAESLVDESTPLSPTIPIQALRVMLEQRVLAGAARGIRTMILRPAHVYGNGGAGILIRSQLASARAAGKAAFIGEGTAPVSLVHIDDLAGAYVAALQHGKAGTIYNLVSETLCTKELARAVGHATGAEAEAESMTIEEAHQAWGPIAALYGASPVVSTLRAVRELGWRAVAPSALFELTRGSLSAALLHEPAGG